MKGRSGVGVVWYVSLEGGGVGACICIVCARVMCVYVQQQLPQKNACKLHTLKMTVLSGVEYRYSFCS